MNSFFPTITSFTPSMSLCVTVWWPSCAFFRLCFQFTNNLVSCFIYFLPFTLDLFPQCFDYRSRMMYVWFSNVKIVIILCQRLKSNWPVTCFFGRRASLIFAASRILLFSIYLRSSVASHSYFCLKNLRQSRWLVMKKFLSSSITSKVVL